MEENKIEVKAQIATKRGMEVYCRLRGGTKPVANSCMTVVSPKEVQVSRPDSRQCHKYKFKRVFDGSSSQKCVFDNVAFHLVQELLQGKSGLLFAYGVTGSGKTFTMTGTKEDPGIMPRSLDAIFNSISQFQAEKYVFKPDKLNGFEIQSATDARVEREHAQLKEVTMKRNAMTVLNLQRKESDEDLLGRSRDSSKVAYLNEDNSFAVFVTYVEIYNNNVYDLLEDLYTDSSKPRPLQSKIVREDPSHNMYVHGITEVEVSCPEEAFEVFYIGQKRKHIAQTTLNRESSRAHTVFNIRVVQAPLDEDGENIIVDKNLITVSQLSLVDLAGTERSLRTNNTGQRLREAGNINNSLMTLRVCLEILRDNQNGGNKMIPYRESRLTHLFKNYFDGEGQVSMIICVSPSASDLDETLHVMKFAEMSQEIQLTHTPAQIKSIYTPGRRKANQALAESLKNQNVIVKDSAPSSDDEAQSSNERSNPGANPSKIDVDFKASSDLLIEAPLGFVEADNSSAIENAILFWEKKLDSWNNLTNNMNKKYLDFRELVTKTEREKFLLSQDVKSIKSLYDVEKKKTTDLETKCQEISSGFNDLKRKLSDYDFREKKLKRQLFETKMELDRVKLENSSTKEMMKTKIRETEEKLSQELERKLQNQKNTIYELKRKDRKLKEVRRIVGDGSCSSGSKTPSMISLNVPSDKVVHQDNPLPSGSITPAATTPRNDLNQLPSSTCRSTVRRLGIPVSNRRHRRSRSADVWLDHRPAIAVPLSTVMQPKMEKRKSISKLTHSKDVTEKTSRYCLMTQAQDSDGDIETRLYKADVIPTSGGGAQVLFNDVEILKQMSPTKSPCKPYPPP